FDSHWIINMTARNANGVTGPVHTYAEYSPTGTDTGLIIYNGMDTDPIASSPSTSGAGQERKRYVQELRQPFNPAGLQGTITVTGITLGPATGTDPVGSTHTVTATITDQLGNPQPNIHVTFSIIAGPNFGASGTTNPTNGNTSSSGQVSFTYTGSG